MRVSVMKICRKSAGLLLVAMPLTAMALPFDYGEFKARLDTTLSLGTTLRMEDVDSALIGITNGGTSRSVNEDDGNLAFGKGDVLSAVIKATHEVEAEWRNYGIFSRVTYFYDDIASHAASREDRFAANGTAVSDRLQEEYELGGQGRDRLGSELDLLDLFVYGRFNIGDKALSARFGRQVVSWGESSFISNGINSINPIDVARFRTPGAELKEALIPTSMLWSSMQLTKNLSAEVVWMTSYRETELDPRGSFFSTSDIASDDGDKVIVTFGRRKDDNLTTTSPLADPAAMVWLPRDITPEPAAAEKQYGVALRYFAQFLNDTEFALYYLTYHSRTPLLSAVRGPSGAPGGGTSNSLNLAAPTCSQSPVAGCRASYFTEFPDNIDLYGISFNTTAPFGVAVQGEYSFRPNQPIQISGAELILASLGLTNSVTGLGTFDHDADPTTAELPTAVTVAPGTIIRGFRRVDMHQAQATFTKALGPTLGAQQFALVSEIGVTQLDLPDGIYFAGPGAGLPGPGSGRGTNAQPQGAAAGGSIQTEGFADRTSWGYRLVGRMDYENVIGSAGLSPRLVFAHDVNGVGPSFNQDTKAVTLGLAMNYLQRWQADIGYTAFFGGRTYEGTDPLPAPAGQPQTFATSANSNNDRDFLALSVSYAF